MNICGMQMLQKTPQSVCYLNTKCMLTSKKVMISPVLVSGVKVLHFVNHFKMYSAKSFNDR